MATFNDFEQGAYNPHEHDYTERTLEQLSERVNELYDNAKQGRYGEQRLKQVQSELARLTFEISARTQQPYGYTNQERNIIERLGGQV